MKNTAQASVFGPLSLRAASVMLRGRPPLFSPFRIHSETFLEHSTARLSDRPMTCVLLRLVSATGGTPSHQVPICLMLRSDDQVSNIVLSSLS